MIPVKIKDIAVAINAGIAAGDADVVVDSISTDSRSLKPGDFFIPLKGEHFDGHLFIDEAVSAGAIGFLTERSDSRMSAEVKQSPVVVLEVADTQTALGELAHLVRCRSTALVVGVTGSTGKTSTKDILAHLTGTTFQTLASHRNSNNEIGTPLTITKVKPETEVLIVEMGMRGLGQIATLAGIAQPDIGIITNIGLTHMEILGSLDNIAAAKAELVEALSVSDCAVLNADDEWTPYLRERTKANVVTFGLSSQADFSVSETCFDESACSSWRLVIKGKRGPLIKLGIPGKHNIANALAAIAAAVSIGVREKDIVDALAEVNISDMRLGVVETVGGVIVVNDAYNANPTSMAGAIETLVRIRPEARHLAVLGRMSELGRATLVAHQEVGRKAAGMGIDILVAVGQDADMTAQAALESGMDKQSVVWLPEKAAAVSWLQGRLLPGDVVLVKGSRVAGMEYVVDRLIRET